MGREDVATGKEGLVTGTESWLTTLNPYSDRRE